MALDSPLLGILYGCYIGLVAASFILTVQGVLEVYQSINLIKSTLPYAAVAYLLKSSSRFLEAVPAILLFGLMLYLVMAGFYLLKYLIGESKFSGSPVGYKQVALSPANIGATPVLSATATVPSHSILKITAADIYSDVTRINLFGEITQYASGRFARDCQAAIIHPDRPVLIQVDTPGGDVTAAWSIYDQIRLIADKLDVTIFVAGACRSAGIGIIMALPVERRWATQNSTFMIHGCIAVSRHDKGPLDRDLSLSAQNDLDRENAKWVIGLLKRNTVISETTLTDLVASNQEYHFDAAEAAMLGVIGGVA